MKRSEIVLWVTAKAPAVARLGIRFWAKSYSRWPRMEHWLFSRLKSDLRVRVKRRVRLVTGQWIYVDPFEYIGRLIMNDGCYEPETVGIFRSVLAPGMVVVDGGAHIGQYTLIASKLVGDKGQVHAFEPDPITFRHLQANVSANGCRNVRCNSVALGRQACRAPLYLSNVSSTGTNSLRPQVSYGGREVTVAVQTLDDYLATNGLMRLDVIKADVEGSELPLLQGATKTITQFAPLLILEFSIHSVPFGYDKKDLQGELEVRGYSLFRVGSLPLEPYDECASDPIHFNVLAVPHRWMPWLIGRGVLKPCQLVQ